MTVKAWRPPRGPRRWLWNFQVHGLPRCAGYRPLPGGGYCHRLLWPWFSEHGNGEQATCRECAQRTYDDD